MVFLIQWQILTEIVWRVELVVKACQYFDKTQFLFC